MKIRKLFVLTVAVIMLVFAFRVGVLQGKMQGEEMILDQSAFSLEEEQKTEAMVVGEDTIAKKSPLLYGNILAGVLAVVTAAFWFCVYLAKKNGLFFIRRGYRGRHHEKAQKAYAQGVVNG